MSRLTTKLKQGTILRHTVLGESQHYIVARITDKTYGLFCLEDGNRWNEIYKTNIVRNLIGKYPIEMINEEWKVVKAVIRTGKKVDIAEDKVEQTPTTKDSNPWEGL
jgi:hypothetical protein